jgi:hypothetical protein
MSLVATYVYCKDGKYYDDLAYRDQDNTWFICFDDDEPVEVVIRETCRKSPEEILTEVGIPFNSVMKGCRRSMRMFGKMKDARAYFINVRNEPFPAPRAWDTWDKVFDHNPRREGVYYGLAKIK